MNNVNAVVQRRDCAREAKPSFDAGVRCAALCHRGAAEHVTVREASETILHSRLNFEKAFKLSIRQAGYYLLVLPTITDNPNQHRRRPNLLTLLSTCFLLDQATTGFPSWPSYYVESNLRSVGTRAYRREVEKLREQSRDHIRLLLSTECRKKAAASGSARRALHRQSSPNYLVQARQQ